MTGDAMRIESNASSSSSSSIARVDDTRRGLTMIRFHSENQTS